MVSVYNIDTTMVSLWETSLSLVSDPTFFSTNNMTPTSLSISNCGILYLVNTHVWEGENHPIALGQPDWEKNWWLSKGGGHTVTCQV